MEWVEILLLSVVAIVLGISLFYATKAAAQLGGSSDSNLQQAHKYLTWISTVSWIAIAFLIVAIIAFLIFGEELVLFVGGWIVTGLFVLVTIMVAAVGIIASLAASTIRSSTAYSNSTNSDYSKARSAFNDSLISALIALGSVGVMFIGFIVLHITRNKKKKEKEKEKESGGKNEEAMKEIEELEIERLISHKAQ